MSRFVHTHTHLAKPMEVPLLAKAEPPLCISPFCEVERKLHYVAFRAYAHALSKTNGGSASSKSGTSIMHIISFGVKRKLHHVAFRSYGHALSKTRAGSASQAYALYLCSWRVRNCLPQDANYFSGCQLDVFKVTR